MKYVRPQVKIREFDLEDIIVCSNLENGGTNEDLDGPQGPDIDIGGLPWEE